MRFRQRVVEYAVKDNNKTKTAIRYHTSRQQMWCWRNRRNCIIRRKPRYKTQTVSAHIPHGKMA